MKIHFGVVGIAYLNRSAEIVLDLVGGDNPQDIGIGLLAILTFTYANNLAVPCFVLLCLLWIAFWSDCETLLIPDQVTLGVIAASGTKLPWNELPDMAKDVLTQLEKAGKLPSYDKLPTKCIIGYVDIVNVTFDPVESIWGRGHNGIKYVLENAHELDEYIYGKNKATPYFYNTEGYDESSLPAAHKVDLTGIDLPK